MSQAISEHKIAMYEFRDVLPAVGQSRCEYALHVLRELAGSNGENLKHIGEQWVNAVADLDTSESKRLLLSFVDQDIEGFPVEPDVGRSDVLAARIAEFALKDSNVKQRLVQLCNAQLTPAKRMLLAEVMAKMDTADSILAGLDLIDDNVQPEVPYSISRQIEANFVEHRPLKQSQGVYTLVSSSANDVRKKLFEMVAHDSRRKQSALALLGKIEAWRLDYGRPTAEPRHPDFESGKQWPLYE